MESIATVLQVGGALMTPWLVAVWLCTAFLIAIGGAVFVAPGAARRFLNGYASSLVTNTIEAALRFTAGLAFMAASPQMKFSAAFFLFGAMLSVTAVLMLFLPELHQRYGRWAKPFTMKILPLYGAVSILLGGLIIYSLL